MYPLRNGLWLKLKSLTHWLIQGNWLEDPDQGASQTVGGRMAKASKVVAAPLRLKRRIRRPGRHCKRLKKCQRTNSAFFGGGNG